MKPSLKYLLSAAALAAAMLLASALYAQGGLMINPKRLVLDDHHRVGSIMLMNSDKDTSEYEVSLVHYEMRGDGSFDVIPDSIKTYAAGYCDKLIRYFPMEVLLPPGESQSIRIRFLKPQGLAAGEYRSHLFFRAVKRAKPITENDTGALSHAISLRLEPIFGVSIPIICRSGTKPATASIDSVRVLPLDTAGKGKVLVQLGRSGDESCYGSVIVYYNGVQVGDAKGIAVYTPLPARWVPVPYTLDKGTDISKGTFRVEYQTLTDNPKEQVLASATVPGSSK